jgi:hypothetical protein
MNILRQTNRMRLLKNARSMTHSYRISLSNHIRAMENHDIYIRKHCEDKKSYGKEIIEHKTNISLPFNIMNTCLIEKSVICSHYNLSVSYYEYTKSQWKFDEQCIVFDNACYHYDMLSKYIYEIKIFRDDAQCFRNDCKVFEQESKEFHDEAGIFIRSISK